MISQEDLNFMRQMCTHENSHVLHVYGVNIIAMIDEIEAGRKKVVVGEDQVVLDLILANKVWSELLEAADDSYQDDLQFAAAYRVKLARQMKAASNGLIPVNKKYQHPMEKVEFKI